MSVFNESGTCFGPKQPFGMSGMDRAVVSVKSCHVLKKHFFQEKNYYCSKIRTFLSLMG
jgi:hypothetical protein